MGGMKTLKKKADALLDYLANKELSFGCEVKMKDLKEHCIMHICGKIGDQICITTNDGDQFGGGSCDISCEFEEVIGHPVMIGDVLQEVVCKGSSRLTVALVDLVCLWRPCDFSKSLNEMFNSEIGENDCDKNGDYPGWERYSFKDENVQALFEFLWSLFGEEINKKQDEQKREHKRGGDVCGSV